MMIFIHLILSLVISFGSAQQILKAHTSFTPTKYDTITGYFAQDYSVVDENTIENFGLFPNSSWSQLTHDINKLNQDSDGNVAYKLFFMARHGEGIHNAASNYYGSELWKCYWDLLPGNSTMSWFDAELTDLGIRQAKGKSSLWESEIRRGAPIPQSFYSSPLVRAADTLRYTWTNITIDEPPFARPVFKEMLRETYGTHYSDKHHNKSYIANRFPKFEFESGFAEQDELWNSEYRESTEHRNYRAHKFLNDVFTNDSSTFISITAHGGIIHSLLKVVHHKSLHLTTGQMVPVIVRGSNPKGKDVSYNPNLTKKWKAKATCSAELSATKVGFLTVTTSSLLSDN